LNLPSSVDVVQPSSLAAASRPAGGSEQPGDTCPQDTNATATPGFAGGPLVGGLCSVPLPNSASEGNEAGRAAPDAPPLLVDEVAPSSAPQAPSSRAEAATSATIQGRR
jgi:hypothetical protein